KWALIVLLCITLLGLAAPYITNINSFPFMNTITGFEGQINHIVRENIPTKVLNHDWSRIVTIVAIIIVANIIASFSDKLRFIGQRKRMLQELKRFKAIKHTQDSSANIERINLLENEMLQTTSGTKKSRLEMLKEFAKLKGELEKIG